MPPTKQQLDKTAWQWAEVTDPVDITNDHIRTAYKLDLKPCKIKDCKRNCKGNPFCINCLGERRWFGEIDDDSWHDIEDPNNERRHEGDFVGLKNLGATCYVNTFLQLWFHTQPIRRAIYKFRETDVAAHSGNIWKPSSLGGHLQAIFSLLELSERAYINPQDFIDHLGLDAALQQDAQEFSKLLLSLLEDSLSQQKDLCVRNVIQEQFCGDYAYVTTCSKCRNSSQNFSKFYELDLHVQGHKTLEDSIKDFLQEEKLEGDNQYMCSYCCSKQNAKRAIHLKKLPPVLNLQLLRFVFDKKTGLKKKLNSFMQFPEVLDMRQFITYSSPLSFNPTNNDETNYIYNLRAVLIHRGPSAYSGHYIAHIKQEKTGAWYKFNDEETSKMKGSNLHLGTEEDLQEGSTKQRGKVPKGYHSSRNAYMLVYTKQCQPTLQASQSQPTAQVSQCQPTLQTSSEDISKSDKDLLPQYITDYVKNDNEKFEMWVAELIHMRDQNIESGKEKQEKIKEMFVKLGVTEKDQVNYNYEWISVKWLSKWLEDPGKAGEIDNKIALCQHGKVHPDRSGRMKCVRSDAMYSLYEKYHGGPRLPGSKSTCLICVQSRCKVIRTKQKMIEDEKVFNLVKKVDDPTTEKCYWVGKSSMRSWKRLVLEQLEDFREDRGSLEQSVDGADNQDGQMTGGTTEIAAEKCAIDEEHAITEKNVEDKIDEDMPINGEKHKNTTSANNSIDYTLQFNEDLLCDLHGNLDPDPSCRKLIPEKIWIRLKEYFPECPEFTSESSVCQRCCDKNEEENVNQLLNKKLASVQKTDLSDLFNDRRRPIKLSKCQEMYVVSSFFVNEWKKFIKDPCKNEPITEIQNVRLLCQHLKYLYPPKHSVSDLTENLEVVYLWPHEWEKITQHFVTDHEITVVIFEEDDKSMNVVTLPEACEDCVQERETMIEMAKYVYNDELIFVRKAIKDKSADNSLVVTKEDYPDPDFCHHERRKSESEEPPEKMQKLDVGAVRKSQRHRKVRGEKQVKVSSDQTLKDLKLQLMKLFSVPPFDQNLSISGIQLTDDKATLGDLKVAPGSIIILQADEPVEDPGVLQEMMQVPAAPEEGFKGTGLLGNSSL